MAAALLWKEIVGQKSGVCIVADILQSVLGLPSECTHNNVIRSCTLSFSCWIQGGHHVEGCGENKWLFSCCISEGESMDFNSAISPYHGLIKPGSFFDMDLPTRLNLMPKIKSQLMPSTSLSSSSSSSSSTSASAAMPPSSTIFKKNMLRRRMDDNGMVNRESVTFIDWSLFKFLFLFENCCGRISSSVEYHVRLKIPFRSGSLVGVQHRLRHYPGKRTFASLNINAAVSWYHGNSLLPPHIALNRLAWKILSFI